MSVCPFCNRVLFGGQKEMQEVKIKEDVRAQVAVGNENDQKPKPDIRAMPIALGPAALNQTCSQRATTAAERVKYSLHPSSRAHIWTSSLLFFSFPPSCQGKSQNNSLFVLSLHPLRTGLIGKENVWTLSPFFFHSHFP